MRPLRFATLGLVTIVALAGVAAAMHAHANHATNVNDVAVGGDHGVDASTDGLSVSTGLASEHVSGDASLSATLPPLPEKPATPELPTTADVPATPTVNGDGSANGGATTDHGSASGGVGGLLAIG